MRLLLAAIALLGFMQTAHAQYASPTYYSAIETEWHWSVPDRETLVATLGN